MFIYWEKRHVLNCGQSGFVQKKHENGSSMVSMVWCIGCGLPRSLQGGVKRWSQVSIGSECCFSYKISECVNPADYKRFTEEIWT